MPVGNPITDISSAGNYVPITRTLTINSETYDLSADRTWSIVTGSVTSVALTAPNVFTVTGSPITTSGTLALNFVNQFANTIFAGPASGAESVPTFRSLVPDDIPQLDVSKITGAVPYTGATGNVNLGEFGLTAGFFGLDLTPTGTPTTQGTMSWDVDSETLDVVLDAAVTMKVGQDVFYYVKNQSGATIPKGSVVRAAGTLGASGRILIEKFIADGSFPSKYVLGVTTESLTNGADGFVTEFGKIRLINTSAFADGDILYASPTVAGGFTTTVPTAPNNIVTIAIVIKGGAANGTIFVRPSFGSNINEDEGVKFTSLATGDLMVYNGGYWVNQTKATALSGFVPTSRTLTINDVAFDLSANREFSVGDFGTW
jgi:hypothetical protein